MGIFTKFFNGLKKTRANFGGLISKIFAGVLDEEFFEELEYILIASDMGVIATQEVLQKLRADAKNNKIKTQEQLVDCLKQYLIELLQIDTPTMQTPTLISFVGVNGVGKTTAIGRLAHYFKQDKKSVLMVAADTFRAAATEQLTEWSKRAQVRIVKYAEGADPAAVVYDGIASAIAKKEDVVLVDTAGRLHTKVNLMEELKKLYRVIEKQWGERQFLNYLVIDAVTGQNAMQQVKLFAQTHKIDGIVLTKLDGTAKGGIVFAIAKEYQIPVLFAGVGEGLDDLQPFDATDFVNSIF